MKSNAEMMDNANEIEILSEYLPSVMSDTETMKTLKDKYGQNIDMKIASITVKKLL